MKASFEPAEGYTRVEFAVQHRDELVLVDGLLETDDPQLIAILDEHPLVRRAEKPPKGKAD